jgi:hypothetical protein
MRPRRLQRARPNGKTAKAAVGIAVAVVTSPIRVIVGTSLLRR